MYNPYCAFLLVLKYLLKSFIALIKFILVFKNVKTNVSYFPEKATTSK